MYLQTLTSGRQSWGSFSKELSSIRTCSGFSMVSSQSLSLLDSFLFELKELDPSQLFSILCFRFSFLLKCTVSVLELSSTEPFLRLHLLSAFGCIYFTWINKFSETGRMPKIFERSTAPARLSTWLSVPRRRESFATQVSQPGRRLTISDSSKLGGTL